MNNISIQPISGINLGFEVHDNVDVIKEEESTGIATLIIINLFIFKINILY